MKIESYEIHILRELAKEYAEVAALDIHQESIKRMRGNNDLKPGRPPVLIDEVPWHEMDIDGQLINRCQNDFARNMETFFRKRLFQWKYFPGDMVVENFFPISKSIHSTEYMPEVKENVAITDAANNIISHQYIDQLKTEADLEKLTIPHIINDRDTDKKNVEIAQEILGDILPVKLRGYYLYYAPWDQIPRLRGVSNVFYDMMDRPEFTHKIIQRFTEIQLSIMEQYEEQGLLDYDLADLHCTPPYTSDLPAKDYDGGKVRLKDIWIRSMAQMFSSISPAQHEEFDLQYSKPLFEKCGLVYYGCCEPLDNKIDLLRKIPNMRKIGVSPWSDQEKCAEQIGGDYVFARKPNPASVAVKTDPDEIRKDIKETVEICLKYGCPYEFVLKDISTVSYRPENLIVWERTVREVLDSYY
ncbi:MAG: hypothetical protein ACOX1R_01870 [Caldicoprobacterales bacterium]|jgi:hypothetical protein|nr:hypothetical protein [Clostridiales bacterium]